MQRQPAYSGCRNSSNTASSASRAPLGCTVSRIHHCKPPAEQARAQYSHETRKVSGSSKSRQSACSQKLLFAQVTTRSAQSASPQLPMAALRPQHALIQTPHVSGSSSRGPGRVAMLAASHVRQWAAAARLPVPTAASCGAVAAGGSICQRSAASALQHCSGAQAQRARVPAPSSAGRQSATAGRAGTGRCWLQQRMRLGGPLGAALLLRLPVPCLLRRHAWVRKVQQGPAGPWQCLGWKCILSSTRGAAASTAATGPGLCRRQEAAGLSQGLCPHSLLLSFL